MKIVERTAQINRLGKRRSKQSLNQAQPLVHDCQICNTAVEVMDKTWVQKQKMCSI